MPTFGTTANLLKPIANEVYYVCMNTSLDVANYFLSKSDEEAGDVISNLKLQKLLYYAQGFHLAITGKSLFSERIEAWTHGPVVPSVYRHFKEHGAAGIPKPELVPEFSEETQEVLDEVYSVMGQFSAWKLRNLTHTEPPWMDAYEAEASTPISNESLMEYFKTQLK